MKLIYLANIRVPDEWAHGIQIMKMCEALAGEGIKVEFLAPARYSEIKSDPFDYYGVARVFKLTRLPSLDFLPGNPSVWYFWWRTFLFLFLARLFLFFRRYDVLYTREQAAGLLFRDFILEIHSLPNRVKSWHRRVWRRARKLVVLTSFIKEALIKEGVPADKILVAPDGVDMAEFDISRSKEQLRQELSLPLDKKIVMYAGSFFLHDWKGADILLEAVKYFESPWQLVMVGGEEQEIERIKAEYGESKIILVGRQPHKIVPRYLKAADVLVLPNKKGETISERYTSPLKLFEYMAAGVPIVVSDLPSTREVMNDRNCLFFEANNSKDLVKKIENLISDEALGSRLAAQALLDVQNYTWKKRAEKIIKFIS